MIVSPLRGMFDVLAIDMKTVVDSVVFVDPATSRTPYKSTT